MSVVIWTTTPWTIPANQAVSLNADLEYALVQADLGQGPERLILARRHAGRYPGPLGDQQL